MKRSISVAIATVVICAVLYPIAAFWFGYVPPEQYRNQLCSTDDQEPCDETRSYIVESETGPFSYSLAFVELDDQGWFWDRTAKERVLNHLRKRRKSSDLVVVVYVHGWRHNAQSGDQNIYCFESMLQRMLNANRNAQFMMDNPFAKREFVGVYVGWRGKAVEWEPFNTLSFWHRKSAAMRIGSRALVELLVEIDEISRGMSKTAGRDVDLIIMGHSFGAQMVYQAISEIIIEDVTRLDSGHLETIGDLTVLVNPALEGTEYEPLFDAAMHETFEKDQPTRLMIVTSGNDLATKLAFPIGRWISTVFDSYRDEPPQTDYLAGEGAKQAQLDRSAVGHLERYRTHVLSGAGTSELAYTSYEASDRARRCRNHWENRPRKTADEQIAEMRTQIERFETFAEETGDDRLEMFGGAVLFEYSWYREAYPNDNLPFLAVYTDESVVDGHSDFYKLGFIDFVMRFFNRHVAQESWVGEE